MEQEGKVQWNCRVQPAIVTGEVEAWRWSAQAPGYMGISGIENTAEKAEEACRLACERAVERRRDVNARRREFTVDV